MHRDSSLRDIVRTELCVGSMVVSGRLCGVWCVCACAGRSVLVGVQVNTPKRIYNSACDLHVIAKLMNLL